MASLDRELGVYGAPNYWIEYYEDGRIIIQGQEIYLLAVLHFPSHANLRPVPFGVAGVPQSGGWFKPKQVSYVAIAGNNAISQHGDDVDRASNAARFHAQYVATNWEDGRRLRELDNPPPFSPGKMQGSVRSYGIEIEEGRYEGRTLEAVIHFASGTSVAILTREADPRTLGPLNSRQVHAKIGNWVVEFVREWGDGTPEILNRFDNENYARRYGKDQALGLLIAFWIVESAGRTLPSGKSISRQQADAMSEGMIEELRGGVNLN